MCSLKGGPSHGYNTSCVKKIKSIGAIVFELCLLTDRQTNRHKCIILALLYCALLCRREGNEERAWVTQVL